MEQKLVLLDGQFVDLKKFSTGAAQLYAACINNELPVEVCDNLYNRKREDIFKAFSEGTHFYFESTFYYEHNIADLAALFGKVQQSKKIYIQGYTENDETAKKVMSVLGKDAKLAASIMHHEFFLVSDYFSRRQKYSSYEEIFHSAESFASIKSKGEAYNAEIQRLEEVKLEKHRQAKLNPTGRKVRILACNASGPAFKDLPIGEVVDELDPIIIDDPSDKPQGVWIWGNNEPIKLLSDFYHDEFEFVSGVTKNGVVEEVHKWAGKGFPNPKVGYRRLEVEENDLEDDEIPKKADPFRYEKALKIVEDKQSSAHDRAQDLLDLFDLPRRALRSKLTKIIELNDRTYFKPQALRGGRRTISLGF